MDKIKNKFFYVYIAAGVLFLEAALNVKPAYAFTVNPGRVELVMPAGESYIGSYIVGNPGDKPVKVVISAEDWSSDQDGRDVEKGDIASLDWLVFMPQEVDLAPNESRTVQYKINIPKEAQGEYTAMIYFGEAPDTSQGGVTVRSRVGNALYVIIAGTEMVSGRIADINFSKRTPPKINVRIENTGNVHVRPKGNIKIKKSGLSANDKNGDGMDIPFNEAGFPVLPQQTYLFEVPVKEELAAGKYKFDFAMEFGRAIFNNSLEFTVGEDGYIKIN